jgi:eukaryotic-like serine/threonine-protein kinase
VEAAVPSPPGLPAGTRFGDYVAVRPLAAGGMAELYLAARPIATGPPELVAIKRLLPHLGWDPEFVRMFLDEVRIAASLRHPNIVRVIDYGVGEAGHYLAMEYLHGRTLRAVQRSIRETGPLPLVFAVGVVIEVALGLHAAHEHRDPEGNAIEVVHRDVSPSNVMVTFDGQVKLLDFGIARVTQQTQLTRAGTLKGKMGYMSPEQCRGERVDRRSDIFGLGILLYELTVGRRAFYADNDYAVIGKVVDGVYARPGRLVAGFPAALEAVIVRALAVEPEERYPSAAALVEELQRFAVGARLDVGAPGRAALLVQRFGVEPAPVVDLAALLPAARSPAPVRTQASPLRWVALASVGAAIGAVGFLVGGLARNDTGPPPSAPATPALVEPAAVAAPRGPATPTLPSAAPVEPVRAAEAAATDDASAVDLAADGTALDDADLEASPERRGPARRRTKTKATDTTAETPPMGDPDSLLPPSWRER